MLLPLHDDNPLKHIKFQYVTIGIIAACVAVFFYQLSLQGRSEQAFIFGFGAIPAVVFGIKTLPAELVHVPAALSLVTSMFLHGGFMHLAGNMLYLWIFGNNIEDAMGRGRFLVFYLLCGIAAVLAQALPDTHSSVPMIGASGAISGVLGAYLLLYPRARVLVVVPLGFFLHTMRLSAGIVLVIWFAMQIFSSLAAGSGPGVAWFAHIGGFVAGLVLVPLFKRRDVPLLQSARSRDGWHQTTRRR
jgi:membrane associated rhomboid family serine protease